MRKTTSTNYENQKILEMSCGLSYGVELISKRWTVNILWSINNDLLRYGEIKRSIPGISEKMLTQRLRDMEFDGIILRKDFKTIPPHVEYSLTEAGSMLIPVLKGLCNWGSNVRGITRQEKPKNGK